MSIGINKTTYWSTAILNALRGTNITAPTNMYVALHSADPTEAGSTSEISDAGSARQIVTFGAPSGSNPVGMASNADVLFPAAAAQFTVSHISIKDASTAGNTLYKGPLMGARKIFTALASTDVITSASHGFADGTKVRVETDGGTLPSGISANTDYYVRDSTTNTFKLAATSGGSAIDLTTDGSGPLLVGQSYSKTVDVGDQFKIASGQLTIYED